MPPLAQMHLLLREHGWEPEAKDDDDLNRNCWIWTHPSLPDRSIHTRGPDDWSARYPELGPGYMGPLWDERHPNPTEQRRLTRLFKSPRYNGVAGLRSRLKELAPRRKK
jgi:hypothetical protein